MAVRRYWLFLFLPQKYSCCWLVWCWLRPVIRAGVRCIQGWEKTPVQQTKRQQANNPIQENYRDVVFTPIILNKLIPFMVRLAHHERNQHKPFILSLSKDLIRTANLLYETPPPTHLSPWAYPIGNVHQPERDDSR